MGKELREPGQLRQRQKLRQGQFLIATVGTETMVGKGKVQEKTQAKEKAEEKEKGKEKEKARALQRVLQMASKSVLHTTLPRAVLLRALLIAFMFAEIGAAMDHILSWNAPGQQELEARRRLRHKVQRAL